MARTLDDVLFPPIDPFDRRMLPVGDGHALHVEQCGNPDGAALLNLHGGPGNGFRPHNRRFYDPARWRIVLFDQRGCGRSTPHASVVANTTQHLIADIEHIRATLGIERWVISGGSWGSCLALAYAQAHPDRVRGLLLRGVFLARGEELDWWWNGTRWLFPDRYEAFAAAVPEDERSDLRAAYFRRLMDPDPAVHGPAAVAFRVYNAGSSLFRLNDGAVAALADVPQSLTIARLFLHYVHHRFFMEDGALLRNVGRIAHLPCRIVQGRYDVITPARTAWELHRVWPGSHLELVTEGNHSADESPMAAAMIAAQAELSRISG